MCPLGFPDHHHQDHVLIGTIVAPHEQVGHVLDGPHPAPPLVGHVLDGPHPGCGGGYDDLPSSFLICPLI